MRVSRQMKDYIEKQIEEKCKTNKIKELETQKNEIEKEFSDFSEKFRKKMEEKFIEQAEEYGYTAKSDWYEGCRVSRYLKNPGVEAIEEQIRHINNTLRKYKQDKFDEIIVTLELGGKKEDLDRMLNEIKFEMEDK